MKTKILLYVFIFYIFSAIAQAQENPVPNPAVQLLITEISAFEETGFEWLEIFNASENAVDLTGFSFYEDETKHKLALENDSLMNQNEYAVIAQDKEKFMQKYPDFQGKLIDSSWGTLKEDGEEIGLISKDGNFLEKFVYLAAKNSSLKRRTNEIDYTEANWTEEGEVSPGKENFPAENPAPQSESTPQTATESLAAEASTETFQTPAELDEPTTETQTPSIENQQPTAENQQPLEPQLPPLLLINEVSFKDKEKDWAELLMIDDRKNSEGADISLYTLHADAKLFEFPQGTILKSGEFFVIPIEKGLTATTEQLILKNNEGKFLDGVCWVSQTPTESEISDFMDFFENEMWQNSAVATCVKSEAIASGESIARKMPIDTNTADDFAIFKHPTKGKTNIIENNPPQAVITIQSGTAVKEIPLSINVDGSGSNDPDGDKLIYRWDFGDGTGEISVNPKTHTYAMPGIYNITLAVEDPFEFTSSATLQIQALAKQIEIVEPVIQIRKQEVKTITLSADKNTNSLKSKSEKKEKKINKKQTKIKKVSKKPQCKIIRQKPAAAKDSDPKPKKEQKKSSRKKKIVYKNGDLSDKIRITEILPNPEGADFEEEWIEIYNPEKRKINLGNWRLDDSEGGSKPFVFPDTFSIDPESYFLIPTEISHLRLNNTKDEVRLFDFKNNLIHKTEYINTKIGESYAANSNVFKWTKDLTPGSKNPEYKELNGIVTEVLSEKNSILLAGGEGQIDEGQIYEISYKDALDPLMAKLTFTKGTQTDLKVKENENGTYDLRKIDTLIPPLEKEKTSPYTWLIIIAIITTFGLNIFLFSRFFRKRG